MMKGPFQLPDFDGQFIRALGQTCFGGADIGECYSTAERIKEGDFNSWFAEWYTTAERIENIALNCERLGHRLSAQEAYLRASNYYRAAMFFLYGFPVDSRLIQAYDRHVDTFAKGIQSLPIPPEAVSIPFESTTLPGYFYRAHSSTGPTLIVNTGYDGTHQECFFAMAAPALKRGYHVLCFEGPGQGAALIKQQLYMRANWETVITPVIDFLLQRPEVDPHHLALYGMSWGGYLAPRAACYEHRLAALIANPGQYNALNSLKKFLPNVESLLDQPNSLILKMVSKYIMNRPMLAAKFRSKMWVHGVDTPVALIREWKSYHLEDIAPLICCPTLIFDAENEIFSKGQAKLLYDALTCPKEYIFLTDAEGAGEHCGAGAVSLVTQKALDWLDEQFKNAFKTT